MRAVVVIPTYNEAASLRRVVETVRGSARAHVLVVDDDSPDGTGELADWLAERDYGVHVLHRPAKSGLGPAYRAGFAWALASGYEAIGEMDADGSHDPGDVARLLEAEPAVAGMSAHLLVPGRKPAADAPAAVGGGRRPSRRPSTDPRRTGGRAR